MKRRGDISISADDVTKLKEQVNKVRGNIDDTLQRQLANEISYQQVRLNNLNALFRLEQENSDLLNEEKLSALETVSEKQRKVSDDAKNSELRANKEIRQAKYQQLVELETLKNKQTSAETKLTKAKRNLEEKESKGTATKADKQLVKKYEKEASLYKKALAAKKVLNDKSDKDREKVEEEQTKNLITESTKAQSEIVKKAASQLSQKSDIFSKIETIKNAYSDSGGSLKGFITVADTLVSSLASFASKLDANIEEIAGYQLKIDTRLRGYTDTSGNQITYEGTNGLSDIITKVVGVSPYVQLKDVYSNLAKLVDEGISYDVEQRAFLETLKDDIATTFSVENATLRQIVRVQQSDSTAARLGEEASLNSFLNSMYQTTEYLTDSADSIESAIYGATSQLSSTEGVAFDYQVQKWLGSLYSVGMSDSTIQSLASAINMLGTGDITGLSSNSGMQNLLVMASSASGGKNYAQLLADGLDASDINTLMKSMVTYLGQIASSTADNKIVAAQYANIFGLSVSDLSAVSNLINSTDSIYNSTLSYEGAIDELNYMADTINTRMSTGGMMSNVWSNIQYGLSGQIAANPAMYATWKASELLNDTVGGVAIPYVSVLGSGVDLETTVADLMQVGTLGAGIISGIGTLVSSLNSSSAGGFSGSGMLEALGVTASSNSVVRGDAYRKLRTQGSSAVSTSSYIGNSSGSDLYDATLSSASDKANSALVEAQATADSNSATMDTIQEHVVNIYTLLDSVINGVATMNVKTINYGLSLN